MLKQELEFVLYDADCSLCSQCIMFILKKDKAQKLHCLKQGSQLACDIARKYNSECYLHRTIIYIRNGTVHVKSNAIILLLSKYAFPFFVWRCLQIIPLRIRDRLYEEIAKRRFLLRKIL